MISKNNKSSSTVTSKNKKLNIHSTLNTIRKHFHRTTMNYNNTKHYRSSPSESPNPTTKNSTVPLTPSNNSLLIQSIKQAIKKKSKNQQPISIPLPCSTD